MCTKLYTHEDLMHSQNKMQVQLMMSQCYCRKPFTWKLATKQLYSIIAFLPVGPVAWSVPVARCQVTDVELTKKHLSCLGNDTCYNYHTEFFNSNNNI